jgi:hypothetical protein
MRGTAKNSVSEQPVWTNSFYENMWKENRKTLGIEKKLKNTRKERMPGEDSQQVKNFENKVINNYLSNQFK